MLHYIILSCLIVTASIHCSQKDTRHNSTDSLRNRHDIVALYAAINNTEEPSVAEAAVRDALENIQQPTSKLEHENLLSIKTDLVTLTSARHGLLKYAYNNIAEQLKKQKVKTKQYVDLEGSYDEHVCREEIQSLERIQTLLKKWKPVSKN